MANHREHPETQHEKNSFNKSEVIYSLNCRFIYLRKTKKTHTLQIYAERITMYLRSKGLLNINIKKKSSKLCLSKLFINSTHVISLLFLESSTSVFYFSWI